MTTKEKDYNDFLLTMQMRYPDKSMKEIETVIHKVGFHLRTDLTKVESVDSVMLKNNQDFYNRIHLELRGYPLFKNKIK